MVRARIRALLPLLLLAAPELAAKDPGGRYRATIRRTSYGIPHIAAADMGSLGYGEGYALAQDHLCSLADQVVRARGERARHFGRGAKDEHLRSDVVFRALDVAGRARKELEGEPAEVREWLAGYAAGYNRYLAETGVASVPGWCRGQAWVTPIAAADVAAYRKLVSLSAPFFIDAIATAAPPGAETASGETRPPSPEGASNGWAIGSERSESRRGMLLANPHYPWVGSNRFWEKHLTIPGKLDVYGVGLVGLPGVAIGFNRDVAWTHTVSAGRRFTVYRLKLVPGEPTRYLYDGQPRAMSVREVSVPVRGGQPVVQRVYFSHHGPILNDSGFPWTAEHALALRDANEDNEESTATWLAMNRARSLEDFKQAHAKGGISFVNTIAASADGRAWYADGSAAPLLQAETIARWRSRVESDEKARSADSRGLMVLDGSTSRDEWVAHPQARDPGVVPFSQAPQLERRDYVFNANDSHWTPHASARLGGYSPVHGSEGTLRSLRTRMNAKTLADLGPDGPAGADGRFSLDELAAAALHNRSYSALLLREPVAQRCASRGSFELDGKSVDLAEACRVVREWDGRLDLDSRGAVLWRELITQFQGRELRSAGPLFAADFDPADPLGTPRGLAPAGAGGDVILERLARAVRLLQGAGVALDAPLGQLQYTERAGRRIPIHGGQSEWEGALNFVSYGANATTLEPDPAPPARVSGSRLLTEGGYPINRGTSFIMVLEFTDRGPRARAILSYGQSGDPASPHFSDQTELFSTKTWRPALFREDEIARDPNLKRTALDGLR
jgi:acyl-homoserine-lactone acylase